MYLAWRAGFDDAGRLWRFLQIFQTPTHVAITYEMIHEARVIPLDGRPHVGGGLRTYMGDARGHFEGNTLVVETTKFKDALPGFEPEDHAPHRTLYAHRSQYRSMGGDGRQSCDVDTLVDLRGALDDGSDPNRSTSTRVTKATTASSTS